MSAQTMARALDRIRRLVNESLDVASFFSEANEALSAAVPSGAGTSPTPFWYTLDPASLLITSAVGDCEWSVDDLMRFEYVDDDFNKAIDVARNPRGVQTLQEATGGDPSRSRAYRDYMRPRGMEQEALIALRTRSGENWGTVRLVRGPGQPEFDSDELEFLRVVAPHLAEGARRGLLMGEASEPEGSDAPGVVILCEDWTVDSLTPGAAGWLSELPGDWDSHGQLPPSVLAVASRALRIAEHEASPGEVAMARALTRGGRWIALHGAALSGKSAGKAAVIVEAAHPARIVPILMAVYGLTQREQEVARRVLFGDSTSQIARTLWLSPHTVQEHLKRIFEKTGVHNRRELVGKVFINHYDPRVRDNERRLYTDSPIRGGAVRGSQPLAPDEENPDPVSRRRPW